MQIQLPEKVKFVIDTIEAAGYEAFAVGGCIRDSILKREPNDWDITTSAKPEDVKKLFHRTIDTGIAHGTVTVMLDKDGFEVTTYRIDGEYEDHRHPTEVIFTENLKEDLRRRDFTINAMAYNERCGLVDIFGGMEDIEKKVIRAVGCARDRFDEDALRILRAIRFSAQLGYEIEDQTAEAIRVLAPTLQKISAERIREELIKLLVSPHPEYIRIAYETGITAQMLPEFDRCMETEQHNPHHFLSVGEHIIQSLERVPADKVLRLTMLLHDIGKPLCRETDENGVDHFYGHAEKSAEMAREILRRLRWDNDTIGAVVRLVRYHDWTIGMGEEPRIASVRKAIAKIGLEAFPAIFQVCSADLDAQSDYRREEKRRKQSALQACYEKIMEQGDPLQIKDLAVTGKDLIAAGAAPGKELGETLARMLQYVLEDASRNTREELLGLLQKD